METEDTDSTKSRRQRKISLITYIRQVNVRALRHTPNAVAVGMKQKSAPEDTDHGIIC